MKSDTGKNAEGPTVSNGEIKRLSVSSIGSFDSGQDGGCPRRWYFEKVQGRETRSTVAQNTGTEMHALLEHYLKSGEDTLTPMLRVGKQFVPPPAWVAEGKVLVEHKFTVAGRQLTADNVPLVGFVDVINKGGFYLGDDGSLRPEAPRTVEVLDWKTTKDFKWVKSGSDLKKTIQMPGYAKLVLNMYPDTERVRLSHVYFLTAGRKDARKSTILVDREFVEKRWSEVESVVREMKHVAKEPGIDSVPANYNACGAYGGCPHREYCPRSKAESLKALFGSKTMGLLNKVKGGGVMAVAQAVAVVAATTAGVVAAPAKNVKAKDAKQGQSYFVKFSSGLVEASYICKTKGGYSFGRDDGEGVVILQEDDEIFTERPAPVTVAVLPPDAPKPGESGPVAMPIPAGTVVPANVAVAAAQVAPTPSADAPATEKRRPGRPRKVAPVEGAATVAAAPATPAPEAPASTPAPAAAVETAPVPAPVTTPTPKLAAGIVLFIDCFVTKGQATNLDGYAKEVTDSLEQEYKVEDIRIGQEKPLSFAGWKGCVAALVKASPPPDGAYYILTRGNEINEIVANALSSVAATVVRGA